MNNHKYLFAVTGAIVMTLIISNVSAVKLIDIGPFTFDGGTFLFPLAYIFGDVLTEVYGYKASRKVIWISFALMGIATLALQAVMVVPASQYDTAGDAFATVFSTTPRIVIASLLAYVIGEFANSYVLAKMKVWTEGKWLFTRTIGSTLVGQSLDTTVFTIVAFAGIFPNATLQEMIVGGALFKIAVEVVFTPLTYVAVNYLKRVESTDVFDRDTNFNPIQF